MRSSTSWGFVVAITIGITGLAPGLHAQRSDEDLQLALGLIQRGLHAEAARTLEGFLKAQPRHDRAAEALYRLGVCRAETNDNDGAIRAWSDALEGRAFALRPECRYRLGSRVQGQREARRGARPVPGSARRGRG